ncbi:PrsW family intramembrane metalloprotease [Amycolatopsis sp. NPDC003865]
MASPMAGVEVVPRTPRATAVLVVAAVLSGAVGLWVLLDALKPDWVGVAEARGWTESFKASARTQLSAVVISWPVAAALLVAVLVRLRQGVDFVVRQRVLRRGKLAAAGVLLAPFVITPVALVGEHPAYWLVCVPSTAFAVWSTYRLQRHNRMPAWLVLLGFTWGAIFATGMSGLMNALFKDAAQAFVYDSKLVELTQHPGLGGDRSPLRQLQDAQQLTRTGLSLDAAIFEELAKGAGIVILVLLCRRWIDGLVSGLVLGAVVGLGFNMAETVEYMGQGAPEFEFWTRQTVSMMTSHVAFSAILGATIGLARQLANSRRRRRVVAIGYLVAVAGHFLTDATLPYLNGLETAWFAPSPQLQSLVLQPVTLFLLQGPFVAIYVVLLRRGLRDQAAALTRELEAEAGRGTGSVGVGEVPILMTPKRRFKVKVLAAARHGGLASYRYLGRLHAAQLALGMQLWHRSRDEVDEDAPDEAQLRSLVLNLKAHPPQALIGTPERTPA